MTVHHIHMNPVSTCLVNSPDVLSELGKISRKDRWGDNQGLL